ncbi:MAG: hypothetical protein JXR07_17025 [Reichenbachiella sp.]
MRILRYVLFMFPLFDVSLTKGEINMNPVSFESIHNPEEALQDLLDNPIDLAEYKKKKRGANSGITERRPYYYQPSTDGSYYRYFWFYDLRRRYGAQEAREAVQIVVYKNGPIGRYEDTNEELICISIQKKDPDLQKLNKVGYSKNSILEELGPPSIENGETLTYRKDQSVIIFHFDNEIVNWLRFVKTKKLSSLDELPSDLYKFNNL